MCIYVEIYCKKLTGSHSLGVWLVQSLQSRPAGWKLRRPCALVWVWRLPEVGSGRVDVTDDVWWLAAGEFSGAYGSPVFFVLQYFNWTEEAQPRYGGQSALQEIVQILLLNWNSTGEFLTLACRTCIFKLMLNVHILWKLGWSSLGSNNLILPVFLARWFFICSFEELCSWKSLFKQYFGFVWDRQQW